MQQCHSGGFIDDLADSMTVILTACRWDETAKPADDKDTLGNHVVENENSPSDSPEKYFHGEFNFHTMNPVRGESPSGHYQIEADADGDGQISMEEVKKWEFAHDSRTMSIPLLYQIFSQLMQ